MGGLPNVLPFRRMQFLMQKRSLLEVVQSLSGTDAIWMRDSLMPVTFCRRNQVISCVMEIPVDVMQEGKAFLSRNVDFGPRC